jgi:predicted amidophosphoribosyltransferase
VDRSLALIAYQGTGAVLVQRLKYANHRDALGMLAGGLAELIEPERPAALTWVPASLAHRRDRGFDQGELLARAVARCLPGVRARRLLDRGPGAPQTGRDRAERLAGPNLHPHRGRRVVGTVVVLDDVRTTGASLRAAADVIRSGGADRIVAATIAVTPAHAAT